jgi:hypothetical protein
MFYRILRMLKRTCKWYWQNVQTIERMSMQSFQIITIELCCMPHLKSTCISVLSNVYYALWIHNLVHKFCTHTTEYKYNTRVHSFVALKCMPRQMPTYACILVKTVDVIYPCEHLCTYMMHERNVQVACFIVAC